MKKTNLSTIAAIVLSCIVINVYGQVVNIPDANFKSALVGNSSINTNSDGEIQLSEATAYTGALDISNMAISDLTGLEAFNSITNITCRDNNISSLDLSSNTALTFADFTNNNISSISLNSGLKSISLENNLLTSLDISNALELNEMYCMNNLITNIIVPQTSNFWTLACDNNDLTELDLTGCPSLYIVSCSGNNLHRLIITSTVMSTLYTYGNENLFCIEVPDPNHDFFELVTDNHHVLSTSCNYTLTSNQLSVKVVYDDNCSIDGSEVPVKNQLIRLNPGGRAGITNSNGEYVFYVDSGSYVLEYDIPVRDYQIANYLCPSNGMETVTFTSDSGEFATVNFHLDAVNCHYLETNIVSSRRRRCFDNTTSLTYSNIGAASATNTVVHVQLPEYVTVKSASHAYNIVLDGTLEFNLGQLDAGESGVIKIIDSVSCIEGITGLTQCTEAWITPSNDCVHQTNVIDYGDWDKSSIVVPKAKCQGDSLIIFEIQNHGSGDMANIHEYRLYLDNELAGTEYFQLLSGESLFFQVEANGGTVRLEADQHPLHPGKSRPRTSIEGCGNSGFPLVAGFIVMTPPDEADVHKDVHCLQIIDSYDPNDKQSSPKGIGSGHYVASGTELEYMIRFQNTGSDTAYKIVVVDTLPTSLDLSSIYFTIASHQYEAEITNDSLQILQFTFDDIYLPDSTTDLIGSNGFVVFKISPYDTLAEGTIVSNSADIYFDFNLPIRTNASWIEINNYVATSSTPLITQVITSTTQNMEELSLMAQPNPFIDHLLVPISEEMLNAIESVQLRDITGAEVKSNYNVSTTGIEVSGENLPMGMYYLHVVLENNQQQIIKVVKGHP